MTETPREDNGHRFALILGTVLVVVGLANSLPAIPGLEQGLRDLTGIPNLAIRKFPYEYLFPLCFVLMMSIVALKHSFLVVKSMLDQLGI